MNVVLSFLISAGIIAFGLWTVLSSIEAASPIGFTLIGVLPIVIGSISFYGVIRELRSALKAAPSATKR
jgi:hypothetical protein